MPDYLTKTDAIKFIFDRAQKPHHEEKRAWRNKINKRLTDSIKRGDIHENKDSLLSMDDILRHAIEWYGVERFKDYPIPHVNGRLTSETETVTFNGRGIQLPNNVEELQALVIKNEAEIIYLTEEVARLRPGADQYQKNCETNRNNAKKNPDK